MSGAGLKAVTRASVLLGWGKRETQMKYLKAAGVIIGALCVLMGVVWIFRGINVLPGSFKTGDINWSYRGGALAVAGLVLLPVSMLKSKTKGS